MKRIWGTRVYASRDFQYLAVLNDPEAYTLRNIHFDHLASPAVCGLRYWRCLMKPAARKWKGARMDALVRELLKCVHRRVRADEELTVEDVSRDLGFTRQYVSGKFHRITGRLLSDYLKEKRLMKAARLLKRGQMKITQISRL
ncbi:MAG: hypothetical protein NDJ92_05235, partial [Thermoanaerobaculia bacterium]|nr:hypothetical protein [Thermoanaerobaculia bacterium]